MISSLKDHLLITRLKKELTQGATRSQNTLEVDLESVFVKLLFPSQERTFKLKSCMYVDLISLGHVAYSFTLFRAKENQRRTELFL